MSEDMEIEDWWSEKPSRIWLRRLGSVSWFTLGIIAIITLLLLGLMVTKSLVLPILIAFAMGVVFLPLVNLLTRWHFPRWLGAIICIVIIIALVVGTVAMVIYGLVTQGGSIAKAIKDGFAEMKTWFNGAQISQDIVSWMESSAKTAKSNLTGGFISKVFHGLANTASLLLGIFISFFILFFVLNYSHRYRLWWVGHMGLPREKADLIITNTASSIRKYFVGTTIIAAVNAVTVLIPSLILGLPIIGSIVVVTFITAFIPSVGGYIGGAFVVLVALGSKGLTAGLIMLAVVILANTLIQQPVQAVAYGTTLNISPLIALLVTMLGGILAGIAGAMVAAPLTAVAMQVSRDFRAAEAQEKPAMEEASTTSKRRRFLRRRREEDA